MSDINLQRFVDIDIAYHEQASVVSTRDTVVLLYEHTTSTYDHTYSSLAEFEADENKPTAQVGSYYGPVRTYFSNGGSKLRLKCVSSITKDVVKALPDDQIVVMLTGTSSDYNTTKTIAQELEADAEVYGIKQKILLTYAPVSNMTTVKDDKLKNVILKANAINNIGATAAYLSKIDFYESESVKDYCFTEENNVVIPPTDGDQQLADTLEANGNINLSVAGHRLNFGGNMKDGTDATNGYALIVLQQLLTERLFNLLTTKLKGSKGLSEIQAVVADEMGHFLKNGYLTTDKVWTDADLNIVYNGQTYNIIKKNEPLLLGYKFVTLPIQSLTDADKAARKTPPMYLIVADSYGIRKVTVNGEVI